MYQRSITCMCLSSNYCIIKVVIMNKTAEKAFEPFEKVSFKPFRDASYGICSYECTVSQ